MDDPFIAALREEILQYGSGPTLQEMQRLSLSDKGIAGSTAAHKIEEIHTPLNLAFITCTTGTSAFQNIVGVTHQEMPARISAGKRALEEAGILPGDKVLIAYPPLVNVFPMQALRDYGVETVFIPRPSRDGFLVQLCSEKPKAVIGEASFLRAAIADAKKLRLLPHIPAGLILIAAGTPLDPELPEAAEALTGASLHDLYGCQEFGWLLLDGKPLRDDILLWKPDPASAYSELIVGGIATGDCFLTGVHPLGLHGSVLTGTRRRADSESETVIEAAPAADISTVRKACRSLLRIKGKIARVSPQLECGAEASRLRITSGDGQHSLAVTGPKATAMWDDILKAQLQYQREAKNDPVWNKKV